MKKSEVKSKSKAELKRRMDELLKDVKTVED